MNDFMYDPMAVRQQPVDPAALAAAKQQQAMSGAIGSMGMAFNPFSSQNRAFPSSAVYNSPMAMNAANGIYGSPQMRQNSVAYMKGDLDKDGTLNDYEANRQANIDEAMAQQ
jgi:hypothetical protein